MFHFEMLRSHDFVAFFPFFYFFFVRATELAINGGKKPRNSSNGGRNKGATGDSGSLSSEGSIVLDCFFRLRPSSTSTRNGSIERSTRDDAISQVKR